jgi:hypothetical protein
VLLLLKSHCCSVFRLSFARHNCGLLCGVILLIFEYYCLLLPNIINLYSYYVCVYVTVHIVMLCYGMCGIGQAVQRGDRRADRAQRGAGARGAAQA